MPRALTDGSAEDSVRVGGHEVHGLPVDLETRCVHWHQPWDVVALALPCCERLHPCRECHDAVAGHEAQLWPPDRFDAEAILCGACGSPMSIERYLAADACPCCAAVFNPGCRLHRHRYFAEQPASAGAARAG
ncbi:CHY zinc finger protein [Homoserinibacter sp. YIM 151385]|uniref:CHY zinc finger protein n=1 Tax=Homoserinibacter sp. YIM 151385 TaxID=2985506 RepID=UPI0022F02637|nr:CHY zinc finger protein [Homoserinibacter sp. YIM 151385]WBU38589.1 CHY zinc finger protein [Homoserinibacter sp. YIM 151385]